MSDRMDERISAWLDGELTADEAREVEARLAEDPDLRAEVEAMRGLGRAMQRAADRWEDEVSFDGFYEKVAARLGPEPVRRPSFWATLRERLGGWAHAHRPALAATVAALLLIVGGGSVYWMQLAEHTPSLRLADAPAQIEDLEVENASAVVYRTKENVTVIWLTKES